MATHVILGAGPVGTGVAELLQSRGEHLRIVTRSGSGPVGTDRVAADVSDPDELRRIVEGATAIYNCVNPPYDKWTQLWPPMSAAMLAAAEASGAILAVTGNLYVYGPVHGPMTEQTPVAALGHKGKVRAQMSHDACAAHEAGRVRTFEVRGSDYLGGNSLLSSLIAPALRKGRTAFVPADLDALHTWTNVRDVAALLVKGVEDERAWGKVWHVPSAPAVSVRELTRLAASHLDAKPMVRAMPYPALWAAGLVNPMARELRETHYQFAKPFVLDSAAAQQTFGLRPAALEESVALDLATDRKPF